MTKYLVLEKQSAAPEGTKATWAELAEIEATSARSAIRAHLGGGGTKGEFVAVPARSFKPVRVKVETKTQLSFS